MVYHTVLFKFKEGTTAQQIEAVADGLGALKAEIPAIDFLHFGANFSDRGQGYDYLLQSGFASRTYLEEYIKHPAHVKVVQELIRPILDDLVVGDLELGQA